jgi:hypothetical protein
MTPQPIGANAYTEVQNVQRHARRLDVTRYQQNLSAALDTDESRALEEAFGAGQTPVARQVLSSKQATLGRHIDIRA